MLELGYHLTVFNRGTRPDALPKGIEHVRGDRNREQDLDWLVNRTFDAALDTSAYTMEQTGLIQRKLRSRVGRFVHLSTGAVYSPDPIYPWTEETPLGPWPLWGEVARQKLDCERHLRRAAESEGFPVTIVRLAYAMGPGNYVDKEAFVFSRLESGLPLLVPGDGQALLQMTDVEDIAAMLVSLLHCPGVTGQFYNIGGAATSLNGFVSLCGEIMGFTPKIIPVDLHMYGIPTEPFDLANLVFPFPNEPFMLDTRKVEVALGRRTTIGLRDTLSRSYEEFRGRADRSPRTYANEARLRSVLSRT
jgi:nucleoside-diphosphate-sugar epimerase